MVLIVVSLLFLFGLTGTFSQDAPLLGIDLSAAETYPSPVNPSTGVIVPLAYGAQFAGRILSLSGTSSYVEVPHDPALNPMTALTLEAWAKRNNDNRCETVVGKGFATAYWLGFCGTRIRFYASGSSGSYQDGDTSIPADVWTHIAVVYQGSGRRYYINGELDYVGGSEMAPTTRNWPVACICWRLRTSLAMRTGMPQEQVILTSRESMTWTLSADVNWLAAGHQDGHTPGSTTIIVNTERLPGDGTYTGNLYAHSAAGTVTIPVTATGVQNAQFKVYLPAVLR